MQDLLCITGSIEVADPARERDNCFSHALESALQHGLVHEVLSAEEINARFPGFRLPPGFQVLQGFSLEASEMHLLKWDPSIHIVTVLDPTEIQ